MQSLTGILSFCIFWIRCTEIENFFLFIMVMDLKRNWTLEAVHKNKVDRGQRTDHQNLVSQLLIPPPTTIDLPCFIMCLCAGGHLIKGEVLLPYVRAPSKENGEQNSNDITRSYTKSPKTSSQRQQCFGSPTADIQLF